MRFAINQNNERIEVSETGERAICPECNSVVIGNNGKIRIKHWKHHKKNDCDSWYEPMSSWHIGWQNYFPKINQEVILRDENTGITHRADICLNNGLVIEIQNSAISIDEIKQREDFYGKQKMIWVVNGETLAKYSKISYRVIKKMLFFDIAIPPERHDIKEYSATEIKTHLYRSGAFFDLYANEFNNCVEDKWGFKFTFEITKDFESLKSNLESLKNDLEDEFKFICQKLYGNAITNKLHPEFNVTYRTNKKDIIEILDFSKKYWKPFLDEIKFPLFFHNLPGLDNTLLYWYQKNKIVSKQEFLDKYLSYTSPEEPIQ